jgi:hypothetical protein
MQVLCKSRSQPVRMINEEREVVASIAQELRQPMASVGYTDCRPNRGTWARGR